MLLCFSHFLSFHLSFFLTVFLFTLSESFSIINALIGPAQMKHLLIYISNYYIISSLLVWTGHEN